MRSRHDRSWRFEEGGHKFWATVTDEVFLSKVDNRELAFKAGDQLDVELVQRDDEASGSKNRKLEVRKVLRKVDPKSGMGYLFDIDAATK